jgi:predicted metal-dependent phosphoesterase TrpH
MNLKLDLHCHTTASDGRLSPSEVIDLAIKQNINYLAITDHDTTLGIDVALTEAQNRNITVIPGIELSTYHNNESIHILGYFKDDKYKNDDFQKFLKDMKDYREVRAKKIVEGLKKYFNISLDYEKIYNDSKGVIARPHIAQAIIDAGYDYTWDFIFERFINKNSPAYVPNKVITIEEGLNLLHSVNAITSLAHPALIRKTPVQDILKFNFDAIEAIYSQHKPEDSKRFVKLAKNKNLLITCGSDFHGILSGDTKHGTIGDTSDYVMLPEYIDGFLHRMELF